MMTEIAVVQIARARDRLCPGCLSAGLIPGPRGGASRNYYCRACGEGWNFHGVDYGVIAVDHIGRVDPVLMATWSALEVSRSIDPLQQSSSGHGP